MSRYRRSSTAGALSRGATTLVVALACGCANPTTATNESAPATKGRVPVTKAGTPVAKESPADGYIEFMKRAAAADAQTRERMRREIYRRSANVPLPDRVRLGFLLTSPMETEANTRQGETMLREILAGESGLHQSVRNLIDLRLREVEERQALRVELREAKGKIEDLLSIESSMEEKKSESQSRTR